MVVEQVDQRLLAVALTTLAQRIHHPHVGNAVAQSGIALFNKIKRELDDFGAIGGHPQH
jgi:hypothetical protein